MGANGEGLKKRSEIPTLPVMGMEKYKLIVESTREGVWIIDAENKTDYVNQNMANMLGYSIDEMLCYPLFDFMDEEGKADALIKIERRKDGIHEQHDFRFVCKDGSNLWAIVETSPILDENGNYIGALAMVTDITSRKWSEQVLRSRIKLAEYSLSHSLLELLQATLDEVEQLTKSEIGFFHFIEDDQETVSLQNWSTRTLKEFCRAEGAGLHYPMDKAGIWVNCAREHRPVINNDYASAANQRGLPPGHAAVIRLLTIPIFRGEKIVAIFGTGNKPTNYNDQDIEAALLLADLTWEIAERKITEEKLKKANKLLEEQIDEIKKLQEYLREQAMRDALTGLYNRHYLHENMGREISRAGREGKVVGVMMIDIDNFKHFNDTYGHQAGDEILIALGGLLNRVTRHEDIACRYGGEEFIVIMSGTNIPSMEERANFIRETFASLHLLFEGKQLSATLSIGIGFFPEHGETMDKIIKAADRALYEAKQAGRNCAKIWHDASKAGRVSE